MDNLQGAYLSGSDNEASGKKAPKYFSVRYFYWKWVIFNSLSVKQAKNAMLGFEQEGL